MSPSMMPALISSSSAVRVSEILSSKLWNGGEADALVLEGADVGVGVELVVARGS